MIPQRWLNLALLTATCMICALLAACGGGAATQSGELTLVANHSVGTSTTEISDGRTPIEWFVGFGTGTRPEQIDQQQLIVERFNASQDSIELTLTIGEWRIIYDLLEERLIDGSVPDIVGPIGRLGSGALDDSFLDLQPWIDAGTLDVSNYAPSQLAAETQPDGRITGLPFGVFPSMLFINRQLFLDAGLPIPPDQFGETYRGETWDMAALRQLAKELTLDVNGKTPLDADFDPNRIVQWGFHHQFIDDARSTGTFFGAGSLVSADGAAQIPDNWLDAWVWYHDLLWADRSAPNKDEIASPVLGFGDPFKSGNVAIAFSHSWYAGSMRSDTGDPLDTFDLAVVPSYDGEVTSKLHADTFRIFATTPHPDEAVEVLSYLLGEAAPELLVTYASFPARLDLQPSFEATFHEQFPTLSGLGVIQASLDHPDIPSHEEAIPNFDEAVVMIDEFSTLLRSEPDLDVTAAASELRSALDDVFAAPTP